MDWTRIFIYYIWLSRYQKKKKKKDLFSTRGSVSVVLYIKIFLPTYNAGIFPLIIKNVSYVHFNLRISNKIAV